MRLNSLPNDKILDWSKLKAFEVNKIKVIEKLKFVFETVEKIVGKGENAGYQHFLLFPQCLQDLFFKVVKSRDCGKGLTLSSIYTHLTHSHTMTPFDAPGKQAF